MLILLLDAVGLAAGPVTANDRSCLEPADAPQEATYLVNNDGNDIDANQDPTSVLQVRWDWDNDAQYDTAWSAGKVAKHSFDVAAVHTIRLQVKDSDGMMDTRSQQLEVGGQTIAARIFLPLVVR